MTINLETSLWYCKYKNKEELLKIKLTLEAIHKNRFSSYNITYKTHNIFYNTRYQYLTMSSRTQTYKNLKNHPIYVEVDLDYILNYNPPE